jgi:hypothetical protein
MQLSDYRVFRLSGTIYIFIEIFLGRQPCQDVREFRHSMERLCPHFQVVAGGLVDPKLMTNNVY